MPQPIYLLGIELNRSSLRLVVQSEYGEAAADIQRQLPEADGFEHDPKDWWRLVRTTTKDLLRRNKLDPNTIRGVGITATTEAAIVLDTEGFSVCPAVLGPQAELDSYAQRINQKIGPRNLRNLTGRIASSASVITKIAWIADQHKRAWHDCRYIVQPADYLRLRLTDEMATDASTASRSVLFNPRGRNWSKRVLDTFEIDPAWLPSISNALQIVGRVSANAAKECGLAAGTPVAAAANPTCAAALAVGGIQPGDFIAELGGAGTALAVTGDETLRDSSGKTDLACHCLDKLWLNECSGIANNDPLTWLQQTVLREELIQAKRSKRTPIEHMSGLAGTAETGADGLLFLTGEANNHHLMHLNSQHDRKHLARAVFEHAACTIQQALTQLQELGWDCQRILLHGPGTSSDLWCQIVADATNHPIIRNQSLDLPARGAAIMAAVASSTKRSMATAQKDIISASTTIKPRSAARKTYEQLTERHRQAQTLLDNAASDVTTSVVA